MHHKRTPSSHDAEVANMLGNLSGMTGIIILVIILLLFGAPKIPLLARSVGQSLRIFRTEVKDTGKDTDASTTIDASGQASAKQSA